MSQKKHFGASKDSYDAQLSCDFPAFQLKLPSPVHRAIFPCNAHKHLGDRAILKISIKS